MNEARSSSASSALTLALSLLALGGCVPDLPGGGARDPNITIPSSYGAIASAGGEEAAARGENAGGSAAASSEQSAEPVRPVEWRSFFVDAELVALVDAALQNNQELNIALQEILVANAEVIGRRGDILPSVYIGAGAGIEHIGEHTSQGRADEATGLPASLQDYSLGLYATWEVDIWRRLRNLRDAAINRYLASLEGRNFMITRVVAEIAHKYYELLALDAELKIIDETIALQESSLQIVTMQFQSARATQVAVIRFDAELQRYRAQQLGVRQRILQTENEINFLVGRFPQPIARSGQEFLERVPPDVHAGMPGDILENRPDVRQAALELEATRFDVRAARARYYPSLSLEAGIGYHSASIKQLFSTPQSVLYRLLGGLAAPLFNRRAITADYYAADARQMRAVLNYERTVIGGYVEVVNRMNLIANTTQSLELRQQQVARLEESIELSLQLFNAARADYLEVLTARRDALEAELQLIETKQQQLDAAVGLYQALGGGWSQGSAGNANGNDGRHR